MNSALRRGLIGRGAGAALVLLETTENTVQPSSSFLGGHGLSFWIECGQGCVLFDTGQTVEVPGRVVVYLPVIQG